jgi:hypothetical protein
MPRRRVIMLEIISTNPQTSKGEYPYVKDFQTAQHAESYTNSSSVCDIHIESMDFSKLVILPEELL